MTTVMRPTQTYNDLGSTSSEKLDLGPNERREIICLRASAETHTDLTESDALSPLQRHNYEDSTLQVDIVNQLQNDGDDGQCRKKRK